MKLVTLGMTLVLSGCLMNMLASQTFSHGVYDPANDPKADEVLQNPVANDSKSVGRGSALFKKHCVECHGPKGIGDGPKAKETSPAVANLTKIKDRSDTRLYKQIAYGKADMPTWKDELEETNLWDLVNYVKSLNLAKK